MADTNLGNPWLDWLDQSQDLVSFRAAQDPIRAIYDSALERIGEPLASLFVENLMTTIWIKSTVQITMSTTTPCRLSAFGTAYQTTDKDAEDG